MDILELDTVSAAQAAGHQAAARLLAILSESEDELNHGWFLPEGAMTTDQGVEDGLAIMAAFVVDREINSGEPVWLYARDKRIHVAKAERYAALPFAVRASFDIFARTVLRVHQVLDAEQDLQARRNIEPPKKQPLKLEDSILETTSGNINEEVDWADQFRKNEARAEKERAARAKEAERKAGSGKAVNRGNGTGKQQQPLTAGERLGGAPAPNKGGRPATNRRQVKRANRKTNAKKTT